MDRKSNASVRMAGFVLGACLLGLGLAADAIGIGGVAGIGGKQWALIGVGVLFIFAALAPAPKGIRNRGLYLALAALAGVFVLGALAIGYEAVSKDYAIELLLLWVSAVLLTLTTRYRAGWLVALLVISLIALVARLLMMLMASTPV